MLKEEVSGIFFMPGASGCSWYDSSHNKKALLDVENSK